MHRRDFITHTAAALALSGTPAYAEQLADTRKRVGLIGRGWYGKIGPAAADPGRAGRSRLALRRRQDDGRRGGRDRVDAAGLEEEAADLSATTARC